VALTRVKVPDWLSTVNALATLSPAPPAGSKIMPANTEPLRSIVTVLSCAPSVEMFSRTNDPGL
jgi:hypothetical protein